MNKLRRFRLPPPAALLPLLALLLPACAGTSGRLLSDDPQTRAMALDEVLRSAEGPRRKAAAGLRKALSRGGPPYDLYAASALEDLGRSAAPALPELMTALHSPDVPVAQAAERALARIDEAVPPLTEALKSADAPLRAQAARILSAHGARAVPAMTGLLRGTEEGPAAAAAVILGEMGPAARDAVPDLAKAAYSGQDSRKQAALEALARIGAPAGRWLAAALKARDPRIRSAAAKVLSEMRPPSPEAALPLSTALDDQEQAVRANAAAALAVYPAEAQALFPENVVSSLFRAAQAADEATRAPAAAALGRTGAAGGKWLANALSAPDAAVRAGAARVLAGMKPPPPEAAQAAVNALSDADAAVREAAAAAVAAYAARGTAGLPPGSAGRIIAAISAGPGAAKELMPVLKKLAARSREAVTAMTEALSGGAPEVRRAAAEALGELGPRARASIPALKAALRGADCPARVLAGIALQRIDPAFRRNTAALRAASETCRAARQPHAGSASPRPALPASVASSTFSGGVDEKYNYHQLLPVTQTSTAPASGK